MVLELKTGFKGEYFKEYSIFSQIESLKLSELMIFSANL
jgi:hypothetical protein